MPRTLLLMRHAKSAWDTDAATDYDRPLAKRGKRDAVAMGLRLFDLELVPERIVTSGARRARKTARRVQKALGLERDAVVADDRLYEASVATLIAVASATKGKTVMLVGHLPDLEDLLRHLVADVPETADGKLLPTGAVAELRLAKGKAALARGKAHLVRILRPRDERAEKSGDDARV